MWEPVGLCRTQLEARDSFPSPDKHRTESCGVNAAYPREQVHQRTKWSTQLSEVQPSPQVSCLHTSGARLKAAWRSSRSSTYRCARPLRSRSPVTGRQLVSFKMCLNIKLMIIKRLRRNYLIHRWRSKDDIFIYNVSHIVTYKLNEQSMDSYTG